MSNLNNLTSKILEEAKARSEEIFRAAQAEEERLLQSKIAEAREIEKENIEKARAEAASRRDRILSAAELSVRNNKLFAKQQVVERVFDEALNKLSSLSGDELRIFIKNCIVTMDIAGDEKLIVAPKDRGNIDEGFLTELNQALMNRGRVGNLTLSGDERSFRGGFILERKGIEINNTFEALIQSMKDELEYEVARVLFS